MVAAGAAAGEAFEQLVLLARGQPRAFVEDSEPAFAVGLAPLDRDLARRVMERVLDQVVEQDRHVSLGGGNRDVAVAAQLERAAFPPRTRSPARFGALRG